jgi:hypothetical protein
MEFKVIEIILAAILQNAYMYVYNFSHVREELFFERGGLASDAGGCANEFWAGGGSASADHGIAAGAE